MSYNNYVDADAAWRAAWDHDEPAVAIIKHTNPCGIAIGADVAEAYGRAFDCDPVSAFGGVVAVNRPLTAAMAAAMAEVFTEVVIAPAYDDEALALLTVKKNVRLLRCDAPAGRGGVELRLVSGGALMQQVDALTAPGDDPAAWTLACGTPADAATLRDLAFAWRASRAVKSNAIVVAREGATVGVGMGQVNRVDSARLAVARAGEERVRGRGRGQRRVLPVPRRAGGADRGRGARDRAAGRLGARRRGRRGGRGGRRDDVPHRRPALLPLAGPPAGPWGPATLAAAVDAPSRLKSGPGTTTGAVPAPPSTEEVREMTTTLERPKTQGAVLDQPTPTPPLLEKHEAWIPTLEHPEVPLVVVGEPPKATTKRTWPKYVGVALIAGAIGLGTGYAAGLATESTGFAALDGLTDAIVAAAPADTSLALEHLAQAPNGCPRTTADYSLANEHLAQAPASATYATSLAQEHLAQAPAGYDVSLAQEHLAQAP